MKNENAEMRNFSHKGTVCLAVERLLLRRCVENDVYDMFANWTNDPEVTKYLTWKPHEDISVTKEFMKTRLKNYDKLDFYCWAVELKATGRVIGMISVVRQKEETRSVSIGYCLGKAWWGRGYMPEALGRVVQFFFEEVGMNRIEAYHDPRNPGSGRVMQKAGMTYEGTLRQADRNNQGICDAACWSILAQEYNHRKH